MAGSPTAGGRRPGDRTSDDVPGSAYRPDMRFLTVAEVAGIMRVSKMTVYRLVHDGRLPALQVGRSLRIPESAIEDYLRDAFIQAG